MLHAIAEGEDNPETLANFARRTMKKKKDELKLALKGYISDHQRLMIKTILNHIDFLTEQIEMLDREVATRVSIYQEDVERLDSIQLEWLNKCLLNLEQMLRINFLVYPKCVLGQG
ncbi:hypothetical protein SAMN05192559_11440 [Halobacillus karajensis]|nr:hypothetical protein SAMN05192559_11440 [Halobacillus karajensis]